MKNELKISYSLFKNNINYRNSSNSSIIKNNYSGHNTFATETINKSNNDFQNSIDSYNENKKKIQNTNYFNKYYSHSIKKSKLLLNNKTKNNNNILINLKKININNKNNDNDKSKLTLKPTSIHFNNIKLLNIKKIKHNIMPLITNNNFNNNILKNRISIFDLNEYKCNLTKPKSLININSRHLKIKKNFSSNINFFDDYEKDFFPEIDYSHLEYNENEIYKGKSVYDNLIRDKINYFKKNKNKNFTIKLEKNFHYGKHKKEIDLILNSLIISLEDMSLPNELQNKNLKINFPLSLLPIFYYKGCDSFQKLMAVVMKVENNFEKITFDNDLITIALNNLEDYQTNLNKNQDYNKIDDLDYSNEYNSISYKQTTKLKRIVKKPISLRPTKLLKDKDFLKFNSFIFFWITNTRNFVTKITLPCVTLKILEYNIIINQFLDFEFLFFLYQRNFNNWEYFVIRYLSGFSKFRIIFRQLGSQMKISNKTIFLKEPKNKINNFEQEILFNIYTDQFYKNNIILFKSFYVNINLIDSNYLFEKIYNIYFSFLQYINLYEIAKYSSKIDFLIKFLEINNDTHALNFNFKQYDEFDIKVWMDNMKKFSEKSLVERSQNEENLYGEYEIYKKKIKILFKKPQWTIIKFENNKETSKTWEIGKELEVSLVLSILYGNTKNWTNLLNSCLKKLNEPVPILTISPKKEIKNKHKKSRHKNTSYSNSSSHSSKERRLERKRIKELKQSK